MEEHNNIKIATWNLCLGLLHKKDYVRRLLEDNNIAILNLQETEIPGDMSASANAIKLCLSKLPLNTSHETIHRLAKRATPTQMSSYKHAL